MIAIPSGAKEKQESIQEKVKYCLYARKSTESEERQVLSIDSQIKEMLQLAEKEGLEVVEMKRESHSAEETGKHKPIITQELYEKAQEQLQRAEKERKAKNLAFTKLMVCGYCGSGVSGEEKYKNLKNSTVAKYIYYGCTRGKDKYCKNTYIREEDLIEQLLKIIDKIKIDQLGMRFKLEAEVERYNEFQQSVLGDEPKETIEPKKIDIRTYAKYMLRRGSITEKRELMTLLQSKLVYLHRTVTLMEE